MKVQNRISTFLEKDKTVLLPPIEYKLVCRTYFCTRLQFPNKGKKKHDFPIKSTTFSIRKTFFSIKNDIFHEVSMIYQLVSVNDQIW